MKKIIAVDFDGTLCKNEYPQIGVPIYSVINKLKIEQERGAQLILWTCRRGKELAEAVFWCSIHGLMFDAINDNVKSTIERFGGDSRKIYADEYWDDRAVCPFRADGEVREGLGEIITEVRQLKQEVSQNIESIRASIRIKKEKMFHVKHTNEGAGER